MKKKDIKYLIFLLLCIGFLLPSCQSEELINTGEKPETTATEEGYLSINLQLDTKTITRSADENDGIPAENYIDGIRVILYNATSDKAIGIINYNVTYTGGNYTFNGYTYNNGSIQTPTGFQDPNTDGTVTLPPVLIKKQPYKMLILINPGSLLGYLLPGTAGTLPLLNEITNKPSHSLSDVTTPISLGSPVSSSIGNGVGFYLSNLYRGAYTPYPAGDYGFFNSTRFLMTNADDLIMIRENQIQPTPESALASPIEARVERALAKVAVYDETGGSLSNNATVTNVQWACDIINLQTYLVRKPANIAPSQGGGKENINVDRTHTYAIDPNYDNVDDVGQRFFRITDDSFFHRTWIENNNNDNDNRDYFEYVTENTMAADKQYEDVTTRVVIKCQYKPKFITLKEAPPVVVVKNTSDSYYVYKGLAFTYNDLETMYNNRNRIPTEDYPPMRHLENEVMSHDDFETVFLNPTNLTHSFTKYGLSYYHNGINYYSIPIRHFKNEDSSTPMGYGRYGVVRNNIYRIKITDIMGPGSIEIPEPEGPDDKANNLKATVVVTPWDYYQIHFEL